MAYASKLLFPHGSDLRCVCRRHQSNQIPHHLSSSKCIPFSFVPLSKLFRKLIMNVYSGVSNQGAECSVWTCSNTALYLFHAPATCIVWSLVKCSGGTMSLPVSLCPLLLPRVHGGYYGPNSMLHFLDLLECGCIYVDLCTDMFLPGM